MNDLCNKKWEGGSLVINCCIVRDPRTKLPTVLTLVDKDSPPGSNYQHLLAGEDVVQISHQFPSGCRVNGRFQKRIHLHHDGTGHVGVWADLKYGVRPLQEFEGFLALCTTAPLPPDPPDPPVAARSAACHPIRRFPLCRRTLLCRRSRRSTSWRRR